MEPRWVRVPCPALSPAKPVTPTEAPPPRVSLDLIAFHLCSLCWIPHPDAQPPCRTPCPQPSYLCRNSASPPRQQWAIRSPNSWLMRGAWSVCSSSSYTVRGGGKRG